MLGVGLSLTVQDFKNILIFPKAIITGLLVQLIGLPLIAFVLAHFSGLSPAQQVGIVLVSTCASGASSNLITHLVKGNVALAISMTTTNSILTLFSIPFIVNLALVFFYGSETHISLPFLETIIQIFIVTILPASLGIFIRKINSNIAVKLDKPLRIILPILLATVFAIKIFAGKSQGGSGITTAEILYIFPWVLALNILAMLAGFLFGKLVRLNFKDQFTISIEVGLHNTALALLVAGTILQNHDMEKPAIVYAMFTFFSAILFIFAIKGKKVFQ
jgi:BASS family bile acid:Na+ symporter